MRTPGNKFLIFVYTVLLCTGNALAQTARIEKLKAVWNNTYGTAQKLEATLALCEQAHSLNADTLYHYANLATQMAMSLHDEKKLILTHTYQEIWLGRKSLFDSALKLCNSDLRNLDYGNAGDVYSKVLMQKCSMLAKSNRHKEALDEAYHFLQEAETHGDTLSQVYCKYIIGSVYRNMQQTEEALQWFYKADLTAPGTMYEESKNAFGIYFLIGMMYNWKTDADVQNKDKAADSLMCVNYLDRAIADSRKYENLAVLARSLCIKADGIGDPRQLGTAGVYLKEAMHIYDQMHDTLSILNGLTSTSNYYMTIGQPLKGAEACRRGIEMIKRGNAFPIVDFYYTLGQCYKEAGDNGKYAETLNTMMELKDSIYKKNSERDLATINAKYEKQKEDNIIIQQKLNLARKNNLVYGILLLLGTTMLVGYVIFQIRLKNQQLAMQKIVIDQKKKTMDAVMQAEENERKRIAADLHDGIARKMFAAKSNLKVFEGYILSLSHDQRHVYNNIFSLVDDSCTEVRSLSHSMMPQAFFKSGLTDAVKKFIDLVDSRNLRISLRVKGNPESLNKNIQVMIYRIIQECLQNIIKHAAADQADIAIIKNNEGIHITIADNGTGFNVDGPDAKEGVGLKNIKYRVDFLNGQLDIKSGSGKGTVVGLFVPLPIT